MKFTLTIGATVLLLLHQFTAVSGAARRVSEAGAGTLPDVGRVGTQLVGDAGLAVIVLLVATTLSVYKPWGRTAYGVRILENPGDATSVAGPFAGTGKVYALVGDGLILLVAILHLTGVVGGYH